MTRVPCVIQIGRTGLVALSVAVLMAACSPKIIAPKYYTDAVVTEEPSSSDVLAPYRPSVLSCEIYPLGQSAGNTCTLIPAVPADPQGKTVTYVDGGSSCPGVSVESATGNVTFTAPAKATACVVLVKAFNGSTLSPAIGSDTITGQNNAPATPSAISCPLSPVAGTGAVACTLTAATPADIDNDSLTYTDGGSTCPSTAISGATGSATFTAPAKGATCVVRIRAHDGMAYSGFVSSAIITGANQAPNTPSSLSCTTNPLAQSAGNICTLSAASPVDNDGDSVTYSDGGSTCAGVSINAATGNSTFTAPNKGASCQVKIRAYDGATYSSAVSSATITGANNAPSVPSSLACATTPLGGSTGNACTLTAASPADLDGDSVTYSDDGSTCVAVSVNATSGNATFTAPAKGATCVVRIRAHDGSAYSGAVTSATITGQNNAPATPSTLTCPVAPIAGSAGNACALTAASPIDADGDSVTYSDDGSTCAAVSVNTTTGNATFTAPASGLNCVVKVRAHDGTAYSIAVNSGTITGASNPPNQPVSLTCPLNPAGGSTSNACILAAASPADPDGDSVSYADDGSTCAAVSVNATTGNASFTAPAKGASCVVKVKAFDGALYSTVVSSGTITGANNVPATPAALACATTPTAGTTNNPCTLTAASPADIDSDSVSYGDDGSTCPDISVSVLTGNATFTAPAKGGSCIVRVKAYDGTAYSGAVISNTITAQNNAPATPASLACATTPLAGSTGNTCTLTVASPVDVDGDSVTYSDDGSTCPSVLVNATSGNATFTAPAKGNTCVVKVRAHDGAAYSSAVSSGTITAQNNAPAQPASLSCPANPPAGSTDNSCTLAAASPVDQDGDSVTYVDDSSTCAATTVNPATGAVIFTAPASGQNCSIRVKAYDGALYSTALAQTIGGANNPPNQPTSLACATTPLAGSTGNACTLTAASPVDSDGDSVIYSDDGSTCSAVSVNGTTGNATFTAPSKGNTCVVKVRAYDGQAYSTPVSSATITAQNNVPATPASLVCGATPLAGSAGNACTLTAASPPDADGDSVTYSDVGSTCPSVSVNGTSGNATFTAPSKGNSCVVKVRAHDGMAYSSVVSSATITAQNNAPAAPTTVSCETNPQAGSTGNACTLTAASPVDSDGDAVTYVNGGSTCPGVSVNSTTGNAMFTAPAKGVFCVVKVMAYDNDLYSAAVSSATITAQNNAPNQPTALVCPTTPAGGSTGNACMLTAANPVDADGDSVTYSDDGSTCPSTSVNSTTGNATFTAPAKGGSCVVKVRAHDGSVYSAAVSSATITAQNNVPNTPASLSCVTTPAGGSTGNVCTLTAASPADSDGDSVTYSDDESTCPSASVNGTTGNATFTAPASGGTCVIKVRAHDGSAYSGTVSSATITAQNNAPNQPASLACATTPLAISTGNVCTLTATSPADPDGQSVTYADDNSSCAGVSVNATTGNATFTAPAKNATCVVKVKAYDGAAYSTSVSSATITGQNNAPSQPQALACMTNPVAQSVGNTCTLTAASPADADGDSVTYSDDGSTCAAVSVNSGTGNASFTAPAKGATCVVKVRAYDGTVYSTSLSSATITGQNRAPNTPASLSCATTPLGGSAGNSCTLTAASPVDADGDSVTYSDDGSTCAAVSVNSGTGNATFTAPAKDLTCVVKVRAHDGTTYSSAVSSATITGQNNAPNTPASLSCNTTPLGASTGNTCALTAASPVDADGDSVTYSNNGSTCGAVSVTGPTGAVTFTAPAKGFTCEIKVRAHDGLAYSGTVTSATITGQNNAPNTPASLVCPATPVPGSTGNTCTLTAASPADLDGDAVTYANDGSTCAAASVSSDGATITFTAPASGATCVMKVKAHDGAVYSSTVLSATITGQVSCPANFISVPGNPTYGTSDFCVAKFQMKAESSPGVLANSGNGNVSYNASFIAASRPDGTLWINISRNNAALECEALGHHLLTNAEWQTIARNIESVDSNWSGNSVGSGILNRGHSDNVIDAAAVSQSLAFAGVNALASSSDGSIDDNNAYIGTGNHSGEAVGSGWEQKRTHTLSNGEVIWDLAGNGWEWVSDNIVGTNYGVANQPAYTLPAVDPKKDFGPSGTYEANALIWGMGKSYINLAGGAVLRGGSWSSLADAGVFASYLFYGPSVSLNSAGFRCAR